MICNACNRQFRNQSATTAARVKAQDDYARRLLSAVAVVLETTVLELRSRPRTRIIKKQIAAYLLVSTGTSTPVVGALLDRDHATVIHSRNLIKKRASEAPAFARMLLDAERRMLALLESNEPALLAASPGFGLNIAAIGDAFSSRAGASSASA